jgi:hypothetical protein
LPWRSSVHNPCCPDLASEVATSGLAAAVVEVAAAVAAAGRIATWGGIATTEMAEAEAFATSGWKGSRRMMGSGDAAVVAAAADQDPCSSMASLGAWVLTALNAALQILETPSDFVDWGKPRTIEASSERSGATWHPVVGGEADHHPQRPEVIAAGVAAR